MKFRTNVCDFELFSNSFITTIWQNVPAKQGGLSAGSASATVCNLRFSRFSKKVPSLRKVPLTAKSTSEAGRFLDVDAGRTPVSTPVSVAFVPFPEAQGSNEVMRSRNLSFLRRTAPRLKTFFNKTRKLKKPTAP